MRKNSTQKLIGFDRFTKYGIATDKANFVFFAVEPVNISVLSAANLEGKIRQLMVILSIIPELELLALDSSESFESNKAYVRKRLQTEENPAVRKLLQADMDFLDEVQTEMATARQFVFVMRFCKESDDQIFHAVNRIEKTIAEHGFTAKRLGKPEIKRLLGLYFGHGDADAFADFEGENYFEMEDNHAKKEDEI